MVAFRGFEEVGWVHGGWIYTIPYYPVATMVGSNSLPVVLIGSLEHGFGIMLAQI